MRRAVFYVLATLLFVLLHTLLTKFLAIGNIVPDIMVVWIVYVAIREGQIAGLAVGFASGLAIDLLSGQDGMLGLAALAKTLAGFVAGYFHNENKTFQILGGYELIVAIGVASLAHNVVYFIIFLQGTEIGWLSAILFYGVPSSLYTTALGLLPMFGFGYKYGS
jgi:rod shape-determining protein MreD